MAKIAPPRVAVFDCSDVPMSGLIPAPPSQGPILEALSPQGPYFEALKADDAPAIERCLEEASEQERNTLLNGRFQFFDVHSIKGFTTRQVSLTHPLTLAAAFGSLRACQALIHHGADVLCIEPRGRLNVFHCLVATAFYEPHREQRLMEVYQTLCTMLPTHTMRRLLEAENDKGLRPLELAVQQGALGMLGTIFNTRDVYLVREVKVDLMTYRWYDVTEYEAVRAARYRSSPMSMLLGLSKSRLVKAQRMMRDGCLGDWVEAEIALHAITRAMGFVLHFVQILMLFVLEMDRAWVERTGGQSNVEALKSTTFYNGSRSLTWDENVMFVANASYIFCDEYSQIRMSKGFRETLAACMVMYSILDIGLPYFALYIKTTKMKIGWAFLTDFDSRIQDRVIIGALAFDRITEPVCSFLLIAEVCLLPYVHARDEVQVAVDMLRTVLTLLLIWTSLLNMQTIPGMGRMVVLIRALVLDLLIFVCIFIISISLFSRHFMLFFSVNTKQGCVNDFSSYGKSAYNLFLAMLNMLDFRQYDVLDRPVLFINHFMFASIIGILLVNILIAVFSNTIAQTSHNSEVIVKLVALLRVMNIHVMLSNFPLVNRAYLHFYTMRLRKYFVCKGSRVLLLSKTTRRTGRVEFGGFGGETGIVKGEENCSDDISTIMMEEKF